MRLWHKDLIPYLPRQQLLGQWRECCLIAKQIAENGTPNHVLVNRVMQYSGAHFTQYGMHVFTEMERRGYRADFNRFDQYRHDEEPFVFYDDIFRGWHNDRYLAQCLANLQEKYDCGAVPEEDWKRITDKWPEMNFFVHQ